MRAIQDISAYSISRSTIRVIDTDINGKRRKKPSLTLDLDWFSLQRVSKLEQIILRNMLLAKIYKQLQKLVKTIHTAIRTFQTEQQERIVVFVRNLQTTYQKKMQQYLSILKVPQRSTTRILSPIHIQQETPAKKLTIFKKLKAKSIGTFRWVYVKKIRSAWT